MAMTQCKDCGSDISSDARVCPKCGAKQRMHPLTKGAIAAAILIGAFLLYGASIPEYRARARAERDVCYQLAGYGGRAICDSNYHDAIRRGESLAK